MADNNFTQGKIDAIQTWGRVCGGTTCEQCRVMHTIGDSMTCQEFANQFPQKMLSILENMDNEDYSYYNEFCSRFANAELTSEELASLVCRKAVFEGYLDCEEEDIAVCQACWEAPYIGDVTEEQPNYPEDSEVEDNIEDSTDNIFGSFNL